MIVYKYEAGSPSDKTKWLGFHTREQAELHAITMNNSLSTYDDENSKWNKNFWREKPEEWVVRERVG